jgi:hypothetical protein
MLADGQGHGPARALNLFGDLRPGGRGADDEHAAILELIWIAVLQRREGGDRRRHGFGNCRHLREVARPGCDHDRLALPVAQAGHHLVTLAAAAHRGHSGMAPYWGRDHFGIALEEVDGLGHGAEAVRIVSLVTVAG